MQCVKSQFRVSLSHRSSRFELFFDDADVDGTSPPLPRRLFRVPFQVLTQLSKQQFSNRLAQSRPRSSRQFFSSSSLQSRSCSSGSADCGILDLGWNGGQQSLRVILRQLTSLNQGWATTYVAPPTPSRLLGLRWMSRLARSAACGDQPGGICPLRIWTCLARMRSLISFLLRPLQGRSSSMSQQRMTPTAKKSASQEQFCRHRIQGAMQPGVPLVSELFSGLCSLEMPRSVIRRYPRSSNTRFQGFMSLWTTWFLWRKASPCTRHTIRNLASFQLNRRRPM